MKRFDGLSIDNRISVSSRQKGGVLSPTVERISLRKMCSFQSNWWKDAWYCSMEKDTWNCLSSYRFVVANRTRGFLLDHSSSLLVVWRGYLYRLSSLSVPLQTVRDPKPVHDTFVRIFSTFYRYSARIFESSPSSSLKKKRNGGIKAEEEEEW